MKFATQHDSLHFDTSGNIFNTNNKIVNKLPITLPYTDKSDNVHGEHFLFDVHYIIICDRDHYQILYLLEFVE